MVLIGTTGEEVCSRVPAVDSGVQSSSWFMCAIIRAFTHQLGRDLITLERSSTCSGCTSGGATEQLVFPRFTAGV